MREIVDRRRRHGRPFEARRAPRVGRRDRPSIKRPKAVHDEQQHSQGDDERADGRQQVGKLKSEPRGISVDAPRHAEQAAPVHREECELEPEEQHPEPDLAERFGHHPAGDLGNQ